MTVDLSRREAMLVLTTDAVMRARIVRDQLHDVIIPSLPPQRRSLAEAVKRHLSKDTWLVEAFLHDLQTLIDFMSAEIEKGIHTTWIADEYNVHGGHHHRQFDQRTSALAVAFGQLVELFEAVADVLDVTEAERLIEDLLGA